MFILTSKCSSPSVPTTAGSPETQKDDVSSGGQCVLCNYYIYLLNWWVKIHDMPSLVQNDDFRTGLG